MNRSVWMKRALVLASVFALCGALAAGCSNQAPQPGDDASVPAAPPATAPAAADSQGVSIGFVSEPDPPKAGDNALQVRVTGPGGMPVTNATVSAVFSMPAMPSMNMPAMRSAAALEHQADGVYRGTGQLSMGGTWNVNVTVTRGSEQIGSRRFSIVAK